MRWANEFTTLSLYPVFSVPISNGVIFRVKFGCRDSDKHSFIVFRQPFLDAYPLLGCTLFGEVGKRLGIVVSCLIPWLLAIKECIIHKVLFGVCLCCFFYFFVCHGQMVDDCV